jgi:hypothetical protein
MNCSFRFSFISAIVSVGALASLSVGCTFSKATPASLAPDAGGTGDLGNQVDIVVMLPDSSSEKIGSDATGTTLDSNCGAVTQSAKMLPPDILIVQDRSLSMLNDQNDMGCTGGTPTNGNCGMMSKWYQVTTAINDVVMTTDTTVNWGLLYFGAEPTMCGQTMTPAVPVATMNATAISQAFVGQPSLTGMAGTPTTFALKTAVTYMKSLTDPNPKYLLVATDGQPNCAGGNLNADDSAASEQAVADALTAGFPTFVVGIGNTGGTTVLNAMAKNGGEAVPGAPGGNSFYQVNNTADLEKALNAILGSVATCVFNVGAPPNSQTTAGSISVFGDGNPISHDATNGWEFSNTAMTQITLFGSICDQVTSGAVKDVTVTFECVIP